MALYLSNRSSQTIGVSLLLFDPTCKIGSQPWRKEAWWNVKAGQTIKPDALNVDLTTVNSWVGIYAYSHNFSWQGTGNAWFEITHPARFNQCGEDETNCTQWVDYYGVEFSGDPEYVVYIGPNSNQVTGHAPFISITPGEYPIGAGFEFSAAGFIPGTTVTVGWDYVYDGGSDEVQNLSAATFTVGSDGTFGGVLAVYWMTYAGTLSVQAVDSAWKLTATATANVS